MKSNCFALNFSNTKVRALQISSGKISFIGEFKIPPDVIIADHLRDPQKLVVATRGFLQQNKIKDQQVIVGLPENQSFVRNLNLPPLPPEEISEALRWRSDSLLPLPFENAYLDWSLICKTPSQKTILLVAIEKKLVDDYVNVLTSLSLRPVAIETRSLSLARLVKNIKVPVSLVIEVEETSATLAIVQFPETLVLSSSFQGEAPNEEFFQLIRQMTSFYQKKSAAVKEIPIYLTGEKASPALASQITQKTSLKTTLFVPTLSSLRPEQAQGFASTFALAQKNPAAPASEETINLLPPHLQSFYNQERHLQQQANWLKILFFLPLLLLLILGFAFFRLFQVSQGLDTQIRSLENFPVSPEQRQAQTRLAEVNLKSALVVELSLKKIDLVKILNQLATLLPPQLSVTHLSFEEKNFSLILEGYAVSREALLQFKDQLETQKEFAKVEIPLKSLEKKENFPFILTIYLKKS